MKSIHLQNLVVRYPALAECSPVIEAALDVLSATFRKGGKVLLCGNGGSAADAEHIAGELMKGFLLRRPLPADESEKLNAAAGENISAYLQERCLLSR